MKKVVRLTESQVRRIVAESVMRICEEFYPNDDEDITHDGEYSYGAMMNVVFEFSSALDDETVGKLESVSDEYIEDEYKYTSVMVTHVNVSNNVGDDDAEIKMEIAVSAADMPLDAINDEIVEMAIAWIEDKTGKRVWEQPYIEVEKVVFDRREYYKD